jgi:hypothetical protein
LVGKRSDASKRLPGKPEVDLPGHAETLAEVKRRFNPDNSPDTAVSDNSDGTFTITLRHAPPIGMNVLPPPVGGYDDPNAQGAAAGGAK